MTKVQLKNVRKAFGSITAIDNIDLLVGSGEFVALLGPSGCGKTTILRMIAGLEHPTSGVILFNGDDVSQTPVQARNVGLVPQRFALFPHMTVEKNIAFGLRVRGYPKTDIREKLDEMLDIVQLRPLRDRFPAQLSGGQMQRVAIARTLITKPSLLMMDEPFSSLDTGLRGEMRRFVHDLQQRLAITTIFVTHDQAEALEVADRVAVILNGRLAQFDPPEMLYARPRSIKVADFMGISNILRGRIKEQNRVETAIGTFCVEEQAEFADGESVHLALRPEAIDIIGAPEDTAHQAIPGTIAARNFLGASVCYTVLCGETPVLVSEPTRRLLNVDSAVWLGIAPDSIWLMPGTDEQEH